MMNRGPRNVNAGHRRTSSDPLGNGNDELDLDSPAWASFLDMEASDLFQMSRPTSFDEETEKQLLDGGEYYVHSPRSRPDSGNFAGILDLPTNSPFGSPLMARQASTSSRRDVDMQDDVPPPPPPPPPPLQQHRQPYATKSSQKKGHRRAASEPFFFGSNALSGDGGSIFAPQEVYSPPHGRRADGRPFLQSIPSQREVIIDDPNNKPFVLVHQQQQQQQQQQSSSSFPVMNDDRILRVGGLSVHPVESHHQRYALPGVGAMAALNISSNSPGSSGSVGQPQKKKETKTYKCSRCGQIKANHICRAVLYDSMAVAVQADATKLVQTHGQRTIIVRSNKQHQSPTPTLPPPIAGGGNNTQPTQDNSVVV